MSKTATGPGYGHIDDFLIDGYTVTMEVRPYTKSNAFVDRELFDKIEKMQFPCLDTTFAPALGDPIYVAPNCPLASEDLRKNFTIKRVPDTGACNVVSMPLTQRNYYSRSGMWFISPSRKQVYQKVEMVPTVPDGLPIDFMQKSGTLYFVDLPKIWQDILAGHKFSTPIIPYQTVESMLNRGNELTVDALYLLYKAGTVSRADHDRKQALQNFRVELAMVNNYNWRDYRGTVSVLLHELLANSTYVATELYRYKSTLNKAEKAVLLSPVAPFQSQKDMDMCVSLLDRLIGIGNRKFLNYSDLMRKIDQIGLSMDTFDKLYKSVLKIERRAYGEEN